MLLAIDVGNTNTVFAIFDGNNKVATWRQSTEAQRTSDEYAVFLKQMMMDADINSDTVKNVILSSVVPDAIFHIEKLCAKHFKCKPMIVGAPDVTLGIKIKLDQPKEIGADRLVNAIAGIASYKLPLILVDFGTATTFDVVDKSGAYCGGAIAPGVNLSLRALHMAAAKLPRVAVKRPDKVIGKGTIEAIQSGIFWGYVGLAEGIIKRIQKELGKSAAVVATGGLASLFRENIKSIQYVDDDLTLRGLQIIYERNKRRNKNKP